MAATTIQYRPWKTGVGINWSWALQRIPMLLFAIVSSYGVGNLLHLTDVPFPFDYIGAISFDIGYLGAISLADQHLTKTTWSTIGYYALNISMSGLAALFNVLSHAGGKYSNITLEDITVGLPFALVGLAFSVYYHSVMRGYIDKELEQQEKDEELKNLTKEKCKYCGVGKPTLQAIYSHYRTCPMYQTHKLNPGKNTCNCLLCQGN